MLKLIAFCFVFAVSFNLMIQQGEILSFWGAILNKIPEYLSKPLGSCVKCFGGQLAFWSYLFINVNEYVLYEHIFITCCVIILGYIWQEKINK